MIGEVKSIFHREIEGKVYQEIDRFYPSSPQLKIAFSDLSHLPNAIALCWWN